MTGKCGARCHITESSRELSPLWLKTGHELMTLYYSDLLDHLIIFQDLDRIIHATGTLPNLSAFTKKPCISLHGGLSPITHLTGDPHIILLMKQPT